MRHRFLDAGSGGRFLTRRQAIAQVLLGVGLAKLGSWPAFAEVASGYSPDTLHAIAKAGLIKRFTQKGAGDNDGQDWSNAMPLEWLSKSAALAEPGTTLLIGFDPAEIRPVPLGKKRKRNAIRASGEAGKPIAVVAGLMAPDGTVVPAPTGEDTLFFKSDEPWSVERYGRVNGPPCYLAIERNASHLLLAGFRVAGTYGDGFFKFRAGKDQTANFSDVMFSDIHGTDVARVIETDKGSKLSNITITDCQAFGIIRGFARFYHISDSVLRNLELDANNLDAGGKNVCQLIAVNSGANLLFENVVMKNAISTRKLDDGKEGYVQGDGIVCELKTRDVTIRNCHASGIGDGAFDLKSKNVTIEDSTTDNCKFGPRLWVPGDNLIRNCSFTNPVSRASTTGACVQICGTAEIVDTKLQAGKGTSAISLNQQKNHEAPIVRMRGGAIQLDDDATLAYSNAGGTLELHDVAVNGEVRTETYNFDGNSIR